MQLRPIWPRRLTPRDLARATFLVAIIAAVAFAVAQFGAPAARAQAYPTITPQTPVAVGTEGEMLIGIADPAFLIQSSTAGGFTCTLDDGAAKPCGSPAASCKQASCEVYDPGTLKEGDHNLEADQIAPDESTGLGAELDFFIDTTPPKIGNPLVTQYELEKHQSFHPRFNVDVQDDDEFARDVAQCSLVKAPAKPKWSHCTSKTSFAPKIPHTSATYTVGIRASDAFGRFSTPRFIAYDPMPCTITTAAHPDGLQIERHGLKVHARCKGVTKMRVGIYLTGFGHYHEKPSEYGNAIGQTTVKATGHSQLVHIGLRAGDITDNYIKGYHAVYFQLVATPAGKVGTSANVLGQPGKSDFTLINPHSHFGG
jgi:hypothetical protein